MHLRTHLVAPLVAAVLSALALRPALARDLGILANDQMRDALRDTFVVPFTGATGLPTQVNGWVGGVDALRTRLKAPDAATDLVQLSSDELQPACDDGLLEKLDFGLIGGKDHYLPQAVSDCGVGAVVTAVVLAWDKDKFPATPTWADFWDVAKYPGKRGLFAGVRGNLEIALLADGVAPGDVYKTLATGDGVDRAFRKLDQLRPYIVWWHNGAEAAHLLVSNEALMTSAPSEDVVAAAHAAHRDFSIQWAGNLSSMQYWGIAKASANLRQAVQFLYFAGTPAIQARLQTRLAVGGTAKGSTDFLTPGQLVVSPANPANMSAGLHMDAAFWRDNLDKLGKRFDAWQAR
jgi:putative spermidine/putrescine transport system substrate-binding protein